MPRIGVLDPTSEPPKESKRIPPRFESLKGKTIGVRVHWTRFDSYAERMEELLREKHQATPLRIEGRGITQLAHRAQEWENWASQLDGAIVGLAA